MSKLLRALAIALTVSLALAGQAAADTTVSFYSHGWGMRGVGYVYFPHAFILIRRQPMPVGLSIQETYGFTAVSQGPDALMGPTKGEIIPEAQTYIQQATLHFTLTITDAQYEALHKVIDTWGGPGAAPYDLKRHNCVGFVAELADALGLKRPANPGQDPGKFLEAVRVENAEAIASSPAT